MRRLLAVLVVAALAGCAGGSDEAAKPATTASVTTAERTTSTERTTTTSTVPPSLPFTVSAWTVQWNNIQAAGLAANGSPYDAFMPSPAGDHLFGAPLDDKAAVYLEAPERTEPIQSAIVAIAPGSPTPARLIGAVGSSLVDVSASADVIAAFNGSVVPALGSLSAYETKFEVTEDLDLLVLVKNADPIELLFIWTPPGVSPSDFARSASYTT